jgi:hypothetical protein
MTNEPDYIMPPTPICGNELTITREPVQHHLVLHHNGQHLVRVNFDLSVDFIGDVTAREALVQLINGACLGAAPIGASDALADAFIRKIEGEYAERGDAE